MSDQEGTLSEESTSRSVPAAQLADDLQVQVGPPGPFIRLRDKSLKNKTQLLFTTEFPL